MTAQNFDSLVKYSNVVGTFSVDSESTQLEKYVSPPLLNYVEPYVHMGVEKTLFYTEVNTNLKVGDRVFIVNGNYDSYELIKKDKYNKGTDGYRVIYVDRCKIALDIDYTGVLPNVERSEGDEMGDYIKVYYADSYDTFTTANKQITTRGGYLGGKFDLYQNNILYVDSDYDPIDDGWVDTLGITASPGFYVREQAFDPKFQRGTTGRLWYNITTAFMSGSASLASPLLNPTTSLRHYSNEKLLVVGNGFTHAGIEFKANTVYTYDPVDGWKPFVKEQTKFTKAMVTKANFRKGDFYGKFNSGIYGSRDNKIDWKGIGRWNGGTLFNTRWAGGYMFSNISLPQSHQASLSRNNVASQKANTYNNGGYGWNYVIDSDFEKTTIYGAIFRNTRFGMTPSMPVVENHIKNLPHVFGQTVSNGLFDACEFNNVHLLGGAVRNSRSRNTLMTGVKHINSFARDVVFDRSTIISDPVIKIDGFDEFNASERRGSIYGATFSDSVDFKVYKFYIGEADWFKLRAKDSFYIKGLTIDGDDSLLNFFDKKFTIGSWNEYVDDFNESPNPIGTIPGSTFYKRGLRIAAFLSTQDENEWVYSSVRQASLKTTNGVISIEQGGYFTDVVSRNANPRYSIDVFVSVFDVNKQRVLGLNFNGTTQSVSSLDYVLPLHPKPVIDVSRAYIIDSHIESGIIENSDWNSGFSIGYNNDLTISGLTNSARPTVYNITPHFDTGEITVRTLLNANFPEVVDRESSNTPLDPSSFGVKEGDILYMNGVDYYSKGKVLSFTISASGSGYLTELNPIPVVQVGPSQSQVLLSSLSSGYGLTITYENGVDTEVSSVKIETSGIDYAVGEIFYIVNGAQGPAFPSGGTSSTITITEVAQTETVRLPDSWKVKSVDYGNQEIRLEPLSNASIIKGLTSGGLFTTVDANNRWNSLGKLKINNSRIKSGLFKRATLNSNLIESEFIDVSDRDFLDRTALKDLVVSDVIFSNTSNRLSRATYFNSTLVGGTDRWIDGIVYNSLLNKVVFDRGLIRESAWIDGTFNGGLFYWSKSYDARPIGNYKMYYNDRIKSHFVGGDLSTTLANNRWSWRNGTFNGGEFYKSDWENGTFNEGDFYGSKWYGGVVNGGRFGNRTTALEETRFYNGTVQYTTVNNAVFYATDVSLVGMTNSIVWENGIFNSGVFGAQDQRLQLASGGTTFGTYSIPEGIVQYLTSFSSPNNVETPLPLVFDIVVDKNFTDVYELDLMVDLVVTPEDLPALKYPLRSTRIHLKAPDGTSVASVFSYNDVSTGNVLSKTTFTTNQQAPSITSGTAPYSSKFKFLFGGVASNVNDLKELIANGTIGTWKVLVEIPGNIVSVDFVASFSLIIKTFTPDILTLSNSAIWKAGNFNGGQFIDQAVWKDGNFNGGKFHSFFGWTQSGGFTTTATSDKYSWQGGSFNAGEFGNGSIDANSTWLSGEFNGGIFKGRVWNDGIFRNGSFFGSGLTASGGWDLLTVSTASYPAQDFVSSFGEKFYGLWRNGLVTNRRDIFLNDQEYSSNQNRANEETETSPKANFFSMLWSDGVFSSEDSLMSNSVWIGGSFENGTFENGSFNPYVASPINSGNRTFNTNTVWRKGVFNGGDFFFSEWHDGRFIIGTAVGMYFRDGVSNYMNAYNVVWGTDTTSPTWNNGNWYGSEFEFDGSLDSTKNGFYYGILEVCRKRSFGSSVHIWNLFKSNSSDTLSSMTILADDILTYVPGFHPETTTTIWYPPVIWI